MAQGKHKLTSAQVRAAKTVGLVPDGGGLYLQVTAATGARVRKSWLLRYQSPTGKRREMGLGPAETVPLATARDLADAAKALAARGIDPIEHRRAEKERAAVEAARAMTFRQAAEAYMKGQSARWRSEKHAKLWAATLDAYAYPTLGALPVAAVDVTLVLKVLEPVWNVKPETAGRVRQRIEAILDWATVRGYRLGENPARWRGHLQKVLPARSELQPVKHHAALPIDKLPAFMTDLRGVQGLGAMALELCILTVTRSGETLNAQWSEFDLDQALWIIPATRMKAKRDHRVPLPTQAVELLRKLRIASARGKYVFPGNDPKKPLSGMAMLMTLRRMKRLKLTVHGFRSTFRDWAADSTNFPREIAEAALAHSLGDKTEAAYRRGDALEKRRRMMQAWADYAGREKPESAKVVHLKRSKGKQ